MMLALRSGLMAVCAGIAVVIATILVSFTLLVTIPFVLLAAIFAPESRSVRRRISEYIGDWIKSLRIP